MFKQRHSGKQFMEGMLIGSSLAAAATFVFGTKKGKALQKKLVQKYKTLGHKAEGYMHTLQKAMRSPAAKKLKGLVKKKTAAKRVGKRRRRKTANS